MTLRFLFLTRPYSTDWNVKVVSRGSSVLLGDGSESQAPYIKEEKRETSQNGATGLSHLDVSISQAYT